MRATADCPLLSDYQHLVRGELPSAEVERITGHLEGCDRCAAAVRPLLNDDTALDALRQAHGDTPTPKSDLPAGLFQRLCALKPSTSHTDTSGGTASWAGPSADKEEYAFLAPAEKPDEIGRLGSYRVLRVLGTGGMGVVFEAEDTQLRRKVALKVMKPAVAERPSARQRFLREARAAAAIEHDHIVPIYQVGEDRGVPFLAMQLLAGTSLAALVQKAGHLTPAQVLRIGRQLAEGLAAAHERGLVHRDIKPGNIWIEPAHGGRVKILDFGPARPQSPDQERGDEPVVTESGDVVGTPSYMAPEQARGAKIDGRADLFSLGCVLYELATGKRPFAGTGPLALLTSLAVDTPRPPADFGVPAELSDLILRLLEKDPAKRTASATQVAQQLAELERKPPSPLPEPSPRRRRSLPRAVAATLLLATGLAAAVIIAIHTGEGTVVIDTDDPDVVVSIRRAGEEIDILDKKSKQQATLNTGTYQVKLVGGDPEALTLETQEFTLKRGNRVIVKVTRNGPTPTPPPPPPPPPPEPSVEPMSPVALVRRPAQLKDLLSWTIETIGERNSFNVPVYSPDGKRVATCWGDATIRIWDTSSGELFKALICPSNDKGGVLAWSPDGKHLAAGYGNEEFLRIWEVDQGRESKQIGNRGPYQPLAWSPDGKLLAAGTYDGIDIYVFESGKFLDRILRGGYAWSMAWSPDSTKLAVGSRARINPNLDGPEELCLWDVNSPNVIPKEKLPVGYPRGGDIFWSPDGDLLITTNLKETVQLWDGKSGKPQCTLKLEVPKEYAGDRAYPIWSEDGKRLMQLVNSAGYWDISTGKRIKPLQQDERLLRVSPQEKPRDIYAWSPDGRQYSAVMHFDTISWSIFGLFDAATGRRRGILPLNIGPVPGFWSPDGTLVAVAGGPRALHLWSVEPGMGPQVVADRYLSGTISWSPDSKRLLSTQRWSSHCVVIDIGSGDSRPLGDVRSGPQHGWSADGKRIATVWDGRIAVLEESRPGAQDWTKKWEKQFADAVVVWSPTDNVLATGNRKGDLCLWNGTTGAEIKRSEGNPRIDCLAWSPDGKRLAGCGVGARIWEAPTLNRLRPLDEAGYYEIKWSDGKTIAALGPSKVAHWDAESGKVLPSTSVESWLPWQGRFIMLANGKGLAISPEGHYRGSPGVERDIVYVVKTKDGQQTLKPKEFEEKYGWKNDPSRVRLAGGGMDGEPMHPGR
jgi:serine/threonine protein kinase/WD40 repeat protein